MQPLEIGVFLCSTGIEDPFESIKKLQELGIKVTQFPPIAPDFYTAENAAKVKAALAEAGIEPAAMFVGFPGESYASMQAVADTVGFVNRDKAAERVAITKEAIEWGAAAGMPGIAMHIGFVPHDTSDPVYEMLIGIMRDVADACKAKGMYFALETGQEAAEALLTFLEALERDNVFINFDPANLILYGKDKPVEAFRAVGHKVISCHCKDGIWPTEAGQLGSEVPLGEGQVNFPAFVQAIKDVGFTGPLVIEREAGDNRIGDILKGIALLESLR